MISPFKYIQCVKDLINYCNTNEEFKEIPWMINTMGYHKGFGMQLMCLLLRIMEPTDVVQIQHNMRGCNFANIITEDFVRGYKFSMFDNADLSGIPSTENCYFVTHVVDSVVNVNSSGQKWISNATEKRKMSILAHLGRILPEGVSCLNDVEPFCASMDNIRVLVNDEQQTNTQENYRLLNGNLVYLCSSGNNENNDILNADSIVECLGIGIVRAINYATKEIYLLMPHYFNDKGSAINNVNILAICNIPLPSEIILKQNFDIEGSIPFVSKIKNKNISLKHVNKKTIKELF